MSTYVVNKTGVLLKIQDHHIGDASSGWGYDGAIMYEIAHDGILRVDGSIFINETVNQRKVLEVHVKREGRETLILEHDVFERNEALIFMTGEDNKLTFNHVPKDIASKTGFADRIRRMIIPYTVSEADIKALIAAAKPWHVGLLQKGTMFLLQAQVMCSSAEEGCTLMLEGSYI